MFFGGMGVRCSECDVIGRTRHRSSINSTFLHSTKESRNLHWQNKKTSLYILKLTALLLLLRTIINLSRKQYKSQWKYIQSQNVTKIDAIIKMVSLFTD